MVKVAAGRAAVRMALADRSCLPGAVATVVALLGPDQSSEVQRQALLAVRRLAEADPQAFVPQLATLLPSVCALHTSTAGPTKVTCERTLRVVLQVEAGLDVAQASGRLGVGWEAGVDWSQGGGQGGVEGSLRCESGGVQSARGCGGDGGRWGRY
jgi:hypothetical protein